MKPFFQKSLLCLAAVILLSTLACNKRGGEEAETTEDEGTPLFTEEETTAPDAAAQIPLTYDEGTDTYQSPTGDRYRVAPLCYEPVAVGEAYAAIGTTVLYRIGDFDPKDYLTEQYTGAAAVLYGENVNLPDPENLHPDKAVVCLGGEEVMGIGIVEEPELLEKLIKKLKNGSSVATEIPDDIVYSLKMINTVDFPGVYYNITVYEKTDGTVCIYDREKNKSVEIGDMLKNYIVTREEYISAADDIGTVAG